MQYVSLKEISERHTSINTEGQQFHIDYRQNPRSKRLSMRMSSDYQRVAITIPIRCTSTDIERFLDQCAKWLAKRMPRWISRKAQGIPFKHQVVFPILGRSIEVFFDASGEFEKITLCDDRLIIPQKLDHPRIIQTFLNERLFGYVSEKSKSHASLLNAKISKVFVKPLKSSYGICSAKKTISYASKLVFAPLEVVDYVCAHEVAHLKEMNHSAAFWKIVKELMPDYEIHKSWLKNHGYTLQHYGMP